MKTGKLVICSMFTAFIFVLTVTVQIKLSPNGYVNLGDCLVILGGVIMGQWYGAFSGAVGSCLADLSTGYVIYAPATFIIKGLMGFVAGFLYKKTKNKKNMFCLVAFIAEIIMILGYFMFEMIIYRTEVAVLSMPGNLMQAGFGILTSCVLFYSILKNKYLKNRFLNKNP